MPGPQPAPQLCSLEGQPVPPFMRAPWGWGRPHHMLRLNLEPFLDKSPQAHPSGHQKPCKQESRAQSFHSLQTERSSGKVRGRPCLPS